MGAYIYLRRSPRLVRKVVVETEQGKRFTVRACSFSYLYKPMTCGSSFGQPRWMNGVNMTIARMENAWNGQQVPCVGVSTDNESGHKIAVGNLVYAYRRRSFFNGVTTVRPPTRQYPLTVCDEDYTGFGTCLGKVVEVLP